jgi:hypothetical protein
LNVARRVHKAVICLAAMPTARAKDSLIDLSKLDASLPECTNKADSGTFERLDYTT